MPSISELWHPPRALADRPDERRVSFLELFFDLVFVVLVSRIVAGLEHGLTFTTGRQAATLLVLVFIAWVNGSMYIELHGRDDLRTRVFVFAQMFCVAGMAAFVGTAFESGGTGFALSLAAFQATLTWLWLLSGVHDPSHRSIALCFAGVYTVSTGLFVATPWVAVDGRLFLWSGATALALLAPVVVHVVAPRTPENLEQRRLAAEVRESGVERFDLLTIIVLGEVVVGVIGGMTEHHVPNLHSAAQGFIAMTIGILLWCVYFDQVGGRRPRPTEAHGLGWMALHLGTTMGIACTGAGLFQVLETEAHVVSPAARLLLSGAMCLTLFSVVAITRTLQDALERPGAFRRANLLTTAGAVMIVSLALFPLSPPAFLGSLAASLLLPLVAGITLRRP